MVSDGKMVMMSYQSKIVKSCLPCNFLKFLYNLRTAKGMRLKFCEKALRVKKIFKLKKLNNQTAPKFLDRPFKNKFSGRSGSI